MSSRPRILVLAHGHPDFSLGGGEIAAYSLFQQYARHPGVEEAFFLARIDRGRTATGGISLHADHEYLWEQQLGNDFFMEGKNLYATLTTFASFIRAVRPDIVHLHHAVHLGYEIIEVLKRCNPRIRLYFTLHEYIPICHNQGQMIKTDGRLCHVSDLDACVRCFPQKSAAAFWQRKRRFQHYFSLIDGFIAPSEFLRQRYIAWGIAPERIRTLENGLRPLPALPPRPMKDSRGRCRFAYFGQITPFKGLPLLLQAISFLPGKLQKRLVLEVHGANLEKQPEDFRTEFETRAAPLEEQGVLRVIGPYEPDRIAERMAGVDWVVVPSIWWENSPVTIQEAFAFGRPVLASNLGGMAEKVRHGVDGLLVAPGNPQAWADALAETCGNNQLWDQLHGGIRKPFSVEESAAAHLQLMGVAHD